MLINLYNFNNFKHYETDETNKKLIQEKSLNYEQIKRKIIDNYEMKIKEYEYEQVRVEAAAAYFVAFLKENAIIPYNDARLEYLNLLID